MTMQGYEPLDLAAYHARYPFTRTSEARTMERIQKRDSKTRTPSGWRRNYRLGASNKVDGVGGAAVNTRGVAIAGKKGDGK